MTARHCPGCRGYTRSWASTCPGVDLDVLAGELAVPDVVPPLPLLSRLRVLIGLPVLMGVTAGPLGDPFEMAVWPDEAAQWPDTDPGN